MRVIVNGFMGKLGSAVCRMAEAAGFQITAGIDIIIPQRSRPYPTYTEITDCDMPADVIIECSIGPVVGKVLDYSCEKKIPIIVCTTGLNSEDNKKIAETAKHIPVFKSANMSIGINLLRKLSKQAVNVLGDLNFDIEIVEKHHNQKLDAPSGTAVLLADAINSEADCRYQLVHGRSLKNRKRDKNEIGIHSVRGGTIVGDHSVIFAGCNEVIELTHSALSKEVFADGALRAARFFAQKPGLQAGLYDMDDLIGEFYKD